MAADNKQTKRPKFVKQPDDKYDCVHCRGILRPQVKQTMCGHRLCAVCVPDLFKEQDNPPCPGNEDCITLNIHEIHPDIATTKELLRMPVYCSYKDNACKQTMKWSELHTHEENCTYATSQCHNPGCNATVLRTDLKSHEQDQCLYLPTLCDNCNDYIPKKELHNGHEKTCIPKPRKCCYTDLGCDFNGTPDKLKKHGKENHEKHHQQLITATSQILQDMTQLKEQCHELVPTITDLQTRIDSMEVNMADNKKLNGIQKGIAKLREDVTHINQSLDQKADQSEITQCTNKLGDLQNVVSAQESRTSYLENGGGGAENEKLSQAVNQMESSISAYEMRHAENDVRFRLLETVAYDGHLIWKITNYNRRKRDAIDGKTLSLYSQPFYTSYYGYRMCARVYLNGDGMGRGSHMSLFFVVMRGEYDPLLAWPFRQRVTLALLDQSSNRRHVKDTFRPDPTSTSFRRPVGEMNIASGSPMFAAQSTVESDSYLQDDTIYIRVKVDTTDLPETF